MAVMRSVFYVPSNNEKMVAKAPTIGADILTLDLEDSVAPDDKAQALAQYGPYYLYFNQTLWHHGSVPIGTAPPPP